MDLCGWMRGRGARDGALGLDQATHTPSPTLLYPTPSHSTRLDPTPPHSIRSKKNTRRCAPPYFTPSPPHLDLSPHSPRYTSNWLHTAPVIGQDPNLKPYSFGRGAPASRAAFFSSSVGQHLHCSKRAIRSCGTSLRRQHMVLKAAINLLCTIRETSVTLASSSRGLTGPLSSNSCCCR